MARLIIVRHGQSIWNSENRFTGWVDVDLTEKGKKEAREAGIKLLDYNFDIAFTSDLIRAQKTLDIILKTINQQDIPIIRDKALNERMYGDLQGRNKDEARAEFGAEQVHIWRRSYDIAPPNGESLKDTAERVLPYFESAVLPKLKEGKNVLIAAHGNSLRALIMFLEELSEQEIVKVEIPTGIPKIYEMNEKLQVEQAEFIG